MTPNQTIVHESRLINFTEKRIYIFRIILLSVPWSSGGNWMVSHDEIWRVIHITAQSRIFESVPRHSNGVGKFRFQLGLHVQAREQPSTTLPWIE